MKNDEEDRSLANKVLKEKPLIFFFFFFFFLRKNRSSFELELYSTVEPKPSGFISFLAVES